MVSKPTFGLFRRRLRYVDAGGASELLSPGDTLLLSGTVKMDPSQGPLVVSGTIRTRTKLVWDGRALRLVDDYRP